MPTVGKKKYPYTKKGVAMAKKAAVSSGKKMEVEKFHKNRGLSPGMKIINKVTGGRFGPYGR